MKTTLSPTAMIQTARTTVKAPLNKPTRQVTTKTIPSPQGRALLGGIMEMAGIALVAAVITTAINALTGCAASIPKKPLTAFQSEQQTETRKQSLEDCSGIMKPTDTKEAIEKCEEISNFEDQLSCLHDISSECLGVK